jgi:selenocysteine-specific elongation factor
VPDAGSGSREPPAVDGPHLTLGTAGHIDHGKTALVTRLTGTDTDRLAEERERGISIELGYAELGLPSGRRLSVVDVPGHERFVRTMVAGATGIDLVLLVVAADDGVMPQTVEHLRIVELLGVERGVVAVTKADLVDDELLEVAVAEVREFLATTALAAAPVVTVSARDGRGLEGLLEALDAEAAGLEARRAEGPARLPVDRVFALPGAGTIVTGTLWRGRVAAGDRLVLEPGGRRAVVRSVQVHEREAAVARAGSRVGLNLRGVERADVERGAWLVAPELAGRATRVCSAWLRLLPGGRPLRAGDEVRVHHGTTQFVARVTPVGARELAAGSEGPAVLRLDGDAAVEPQDRFILRSLSPVSTLGGGVVLVPGLQRWHEREAQARFLAAVHTGDLAAAALLLAGERAATGIAPADLTSLGARAPETSVILDGLAGRGELERLEHGPPATSAARWFAPGVLAALRQQLLTAAAGLAAERPERPFSAAGELGASVPAASAEVVQAILDALLAEGRLVAGEGGYGPVGATGVLDERQEALAVRLDEAIAAEPFAPPTLAVLAEPEALPERELRRVLDVLVRRGRLVRADKDLWFSAGAVDEARRRLVTALDEEERVTLARFRDLLGSGRRSAQALLELFDREGLTRRVGDARVARRRA